jgi:hypothetical protein
MSPLSPVFRTCGAAAIYAVAFSLGVSQLQAQERHAANDSADDRLIVHEWGTFTSFSGSDGVNLEYRPLVTNDLPRFVMTSYNQPGHPFALLLKVRYVARQRMETPVTYFYTDRPRTVNVRVDFPAGMLSEWYPVVADFDSGEDQKTNAVVGNAYLNWDQIRLIPPDEFSKVRVRGPNDQPMPAELPFVNPKYHYGQARETDSAIVETVDVTGGSHFEKFLFYRGLGNFQQSVQLSALGNDRFEVHNSADVATGPMFIVRITDEKLRFTNLHPLLPHESIETDLPTPESTIEELAEQMVERLTAAGLYEKESHAMVNTWRDSWFAEPGTRLLYFLPQQLTDEIIPLTIDPTPDECIRILVGRLETLTPEDCRELRQLASNPTSRKLKAKLDQSGRFTEPALQFVIEQTRDVPARDRLTKELANLRDGSPH